MATTLKHPPHHVFERLGTAELFPSVPIEPRGWFGFQRRRQCRRDGGHWWHPTDASIEWGCCRCGARRDGMPKDGT
jgi:hypothetical protein